MKVNRRNFSRHSHISTCILAWRMLTHHVYMNITFFRHQMLWYIELIANGPHLNRKLILDADSCSCFFKRSFRMLVLDKLHPTYRWLCRWFRSRTLHSKSPKFYALVYVFLAPPRKSTYLYRNSRLCIIWLDLSPIHWLFSTHSGPIS